LDEIFDEKDVEVVMITDENMSKDSNNGRNEMITVDDEPEGEEEESTSTSKEHGIPSTNGGDGEKEMKTKTAEHILTENFTKLILDEAKKAVLTKKSQSGYHSDPDR